MLNRGPVSWYSKRQSTVTLSSTKIEYIALTLAAKEATWLYLLLTELGLLQPDKQYALIKVSQNNTCIQNIHENLDIANERKETNVRVGKMIIPLKGNNQG